MRRLNQEDVIKNFINIHGDKYDYTHVTYVNMKTKVKIYCKEKNHGWFLQSPEVHLRRSGCPLCNSQKIKKDINSIWKLRPDLVVYFKNEEDSYKYTLQSNKRLIFVCPICKSERCMSVQYFTEHGLNCRNCSDNISIPEKFCMKLLRCNNIEFEMEKTFKWSKRKRYDFYIPSLNMIIETHGVQHYEETSKHYKKTLQQEQENDRLKYDLAIRNGIKPENYIVIDCRKSEMDWLKDNLKISISKYIDLNNVDWDAIWRECHTSIKNDVWNYWNNKKEYESTSDISAIFKISRTTAIKWLNQGSKLGVCDYDAKSESKKPNPNPSTRKKVYQFSKDMVFIREWQSPIRVQEEIGINKAHISQCALGKRKSAGGYIWKYDFGVDMILEGDYE